MYDAINKGFAHTTGEVMAWLNSDDRYLPWAFSVVSEIFARLPEVEWLTTCFPLTWDVRGRAIACGYRPGFSREAFLRGENLPGGPWYATSYIQQESTFWRRSLWERAGGRVDTTYRLAADFDLWARFARHADLYAVGTPLGGFRSHGDQKTARELTAYFEEACRSLASHGGRPYGPLESWAQRAIQTRLPGRVRKWSVGGGLVARRPVIVHAASGWRVADVLSAG
jgi:hypothetical protein